MGKKLNGLAWYATKRILQGIPLILLVVIICFVLIKLAPGDPISVMTAGYDPPPEMRAALEKQWGLNDPIVVQLARYMGRMLTGDFGKSYMQGKSVLEIIMNRLPSTLVLMISAILVSSLIGIIAGVISAYKMHSTIDGALMTSALFGYSAPLFWVGQVLILIFAVKLNWLPVSGMYDLRLSAEGITKVLDVARHLVLPGLSLSFWFSALMTRVTRTKLSEVLQSDYIKTARAKGLSEFRVLIGHGLRNALAPVITVLGFELGAVIMGATVVETIFGWPGTGRLMYDAVLNRDYPIITGMFFFVSFSIIVVNILVDIMYAVLDPQIRYE